MLFSKAIISSLYKLMLFMFFLLVMDFVLNVILVFISKLTRVWQLHTKNLLLPLDCSSFRCTII